MEGSNNLVGRSLAGRYKLIKMIGQGGMGSVYQAHDSQMSNRVVAVKVLAPHLVSDEKQVMRFEQEARAANQLRHPNTISVIDFGQSDGHIYMVIEFLTGDTLTAVLKEGRMEIARAVYMMRQVCKSLAEAHAKGIIHRDLKPDNIFVCEIYGEKDFIKVIDFGIAKFLESGGAELTQAGKMFGTPRYLSPEQAQGLPLTAASDLYALGVILFEMICGRPPFVAEDPIAVAIKHVQETPPSFAEVAPDLFVPDELDHLIFKLLAKKPLQRYQSAEEVVAAFDQVMQAVTGASRHPSGQFPAIANRTPSRPRTIPPTSSDEPERTRALDSLSMPSPAGKNGGGGRNKANQSGNHAAPEAEATRFLDAMPDVAGPAEATMALDTATALAGIEAYKAKAKTGKTGERTAVAGKGDAAVAAKKSSNAMALIIVAVGAVLAVVAVVVYSLTRTPPAAETVAQSDKKPGDAEKSADAKPVDKDDDGHKGKAEAKEGTAKKDSAAKKDNDAKKDDAKKDEAGKAALAVAKVEHQISIVSTPSNANVELDGAPVGKTPYVVKLQDGGPNHSVVIKLDEFEDYKLEIQSDSLIKAGVKEMPIQLKAKPKAVAKPVAKPVGAKKPKLDW